MLLIEFLFSGLVERVKKKCFKLARYIPSIRVKIDSELSKINDSFEKEALNRVKSIPFIVKLPKEGFSHDDVLKFVHECVQLGTDIMFI